MLKMGNRDQAANLDRVPGADSEETDAASAGGEAGAGYLGEDREFHQRRVVSLAAEDEDS